MSVSLPLTAVGLQDSSGAFYGFIIPPCGKKRGLNKQLACSFMSAETQNKKQTKTKNESGKRKENKSVSPNLGKKLDEEKT